MRRDESEFPPSGCRWCDRARDGYMQRWASGVGFHRFEAPYKRLILERLREKYASRLAGGA
jgi:hypothetical protein